MKNRVKSEEDRLRRVIVCAPRREYFQVDNLKAHNIEAVANPTRAREQHKQLRAALCQAGARVVNIRELHGHPNSVFARDASLVTPEGYIKLRMGLPTRRGEENWLGTELEALGVPRAGQIESPGTVEGGDIILAGRVVFLGQSGRSNASGVRQLSRLLSRMGFEVRAIRLAAERLHLGGEMSLVGPETVLCYRQIFPRGYFAGFKTIQIRCSEKASANVIALGDGEVICEKKNMVGAEALSKAGFQVRLLDLSEFVKGRGGPTCLIMPVERAD